MSLSSITSAMGVGLAYNLSTSRNPLKPVAATYFSVTFGYWCVIKTYSAFAFGGSVGLPNKGQSWQGSLLLVSGSTAAGTTARSSTTPRC